MAAPLLVAAEHPQQHTHGWLGSPCYAAAGAMVVRTTVVGSWDVEEVAGVVVELG